MQTRFQWALVEFGVQDLEFDLHPEILNPEP